MLKDDANKKLYSFFWPTFSTMSGNTMRYTQGMHYYVIGTPISHSASPELWNAYFHRLGLPHDYAAYDPGDFAGLSRWVRAVRRDPDVAGFNVTLPYKRDIIALLDDVTATAGAIGAVNTVRRNTDATLIGDNTDAAGFLSAAESHLRFVPRCHTRVAICGTGGVARAIAYACRHADVTCVSRNPRKLPPVSAATDETSVTGTGHVVSYTDLSTGSPEPWDLLVNATPIGMTGDDMMPVSADWLRPEHVHAVFDAVYRADGQVTPLVAAARAVGIPAIAGMPLLYAQARAACTFWSLPDDF
ncbi:MAG: shikimate dehydrogenase [Actinomycetes bacterium]|nr:shikimate dehydrogenase [Actinomycetes bacterium]